MYLVCCGCLILALIGSISGYYDGLIVSSKANQYYLDKQKFLFEILLRIEDPLLKEEWLRTGADLVLDKQQYVEYNDDMITFYDAFEARKLLPRGQYFNALLHANHAQQSRGLYYYFYHARDWDTLRINICWARRHLNEGLFLHALIQALLRREDFRDLIMPKIYELVPQHFHQRKFVHRAESFDYGNWWIQQQLQPIHVAKTRNVTNRTLSNENNSCHRQWWRPMGLHEQIYVEPKKYILPRQLENGLRNSTQWHQAMAEVKLLWMPAKYTDERLAYLTEDVGWNSYWYYLNMGLAATVPSKSTEQRHELRNWWFWQLQQLLARYQMERQAHGLNEDLVKLARYEPDLQSWTGERFRTLPLNDDPIMLALEQLLARVRLALSEQSLKLRHGQRIPLQGAAQLQPILDELLEQLLPEIASKLAKKFPHPAQLYHFETMLRDPSFYVYAELLLQSYWRIRAALLPSYMTGGAPELSLPGVKLLSVKVSLLQTHFELVDQDVTNLFNNKLFYYAGQLLRQKILVARQHRLQHRPFRLLFNVTATEPQSVILRTFLAPARAQNARNFYQIDTFVTHLDAGTQFIERRSLDFYATSKDHPTHTELYRLMLLAAQDNYDFPLNITTPYCGFPQRLQLPQGCASGLPLQLVTIATPYDYVFKNAYSLECDFAQGVSSFDEHAFGFPFDRPLELRELLKLPNVFGSHVKVYHSERRRRKL